MGDKGWKKRGEVNLIIADFNYLYIVMLGSYTLHSQSGDRSQITARTSSLLGFQS